MSVNRNVTVPPGRDTPLPYKGAEPAGERDVPVPAPARRRPTGTTRRGSRRAGAGTGTSRSPAGNPVEWYPWGDDALAKARAEDKPILLSVGYAACHWCHV